MAAEPFLDLSTIDLDHLCYTKEQVYAKLPHRYEFMFVDGFVHVDLDNLLAVGVRDVGEDEFWVRGHIPGRPLFPGVLMIETAAQMASFMTHLIRPEDDRFLGFGGVDAVKFRGTVTPGCKMYVILKGISIKPRRTICDAQGIVDGKLVFEARITGLAL